MRGLALAFAFLTRLPLPSALRPAVTGDEGMRWAAVWFPVVGGAVGALAALAYRIAGEAYGEATSAALAVAVSVLATGGFHLDGLADTADGLGASGGRDKALEVMRDPRVGSMGALALVVVLMLKVLFVAEAGPHLAPGALVAASALGRWAMVTTMPFHRYARAEPGLGRGFCDHVGRRDALLATLLTAALMAALTAGGLLPVGPGGAALTAGLAAAGGWGVAALAARRLGGVTGDVFGAISEVAEAAALGTVAAL